MKILVTNDDGIHADGLWAVARTLAQKHNVVVVAPDREQSGVGTSITLNAPIKVRQVHNHAEGILTYAVEGTPADCVLLGLTSLLPEIPELVVAGINRGANLGVDVLVSGTVGAALRGYFHGLPSIAVSIMAVRQAPIYDGCLAVTSLLVDLVAGGALPSDICLNVNLPNLPIPDIQGIEITHLARRGFVEITTERDEKRPESFYWPTRGKLNFGEGEDGTDMGALAKNRISITPLHSNITHSGHFSPLEGQLAFLLDSIKETSL